jgi:hypothetical protein
VAALHGSGEVAALHGSSAAVAPFPRLQVPAGPPCPGRRTALLEETLVPGGSSYIPNIKTRLDLRPKSCVACCCRFGMISTNGIKWL